MLSASFYIAWCTAKNRLLVRLRRLREPRYLIGAVAGIAYFYFAIFARGGRGGTRPGRGRAQDRGFDALPVFQIAGTSIAGLFVMCFALLPWVLPSRSKLLDFSQSEREFLSRRPSRGDTCSCTASSDRKSASIIASLFIGLFAAPIAGVGRLRLALGFWVLAVTINVYSAAVSLTRARFQSPVAAVRRVGWAAIGLLLACDCGGRRRASSVICWSSRRRAAADVFVQIARVTSTGCCRRSCCGRSSRSSRPPFSGTLGDVRPRARVGASRARLQ